MIHIYRACNGGAVEHLLSTETKAPQVAIEDELGIQQKDMSDLFYVCDDAGEQYLYPHAMQFCYEYPEAYVYEINREKQRYIIVWRGKGTLWVQVEWSPNEDSEKDPYLEYESSVTLEDVHSFTPTPEEVMVGIMALTDQLAPTHLSHILYEEGFFAVIKGLRQDLKEAAEALRPYKNL